MDLNILMIISSICILFILGRIFSVPIKWGVKFIFNSLLGVFFIWIINLIGGIWGFHLGVNAYTSILVRYFGTAWGNMFDYYKISINIKSTYLER